MNIVDTRSKSCYNDTMTTWFTSDPHYGHKNILKLCNRPFASIEEMNERLIANYNYLVHSGDNVYILGDFSFGDAAFTNSVLSRLNGNKHLIFGNHDHVFFKDKSLLSHFVWARDMSEIKVQDQRIVLCHYSMRVWNKSHFGSYQLYGHSHGTLPDDPNLLSMDVGVDPCHYKPISFDEVRAHMDKKTFKPIDHHGEKK